jgi:uncharacterized iron-regulated protein
MLKKYSLIVGFISLVIFDLTGQYKILSSQGDEVTLAQMVTEVKNANVIFFGEQHDDTIAHKAQYDVLSELYNAKNGKVVLSMEMFETDVQYIVDEYLKGQITEQSFKTDARSWPNYEKDYKPMVEFMKSQKGKVIAANAPRRYVRMVSRNGLNTLKSLDKKALSLLPTLPIDTLTGRYYERFVEIMGGHSTGLSKIYHAQCLWDACMAQSIASAAKKQKNSTIIHMVGKFHCEENLGTVQQLQKKNKKLTIKNIVALKKSEFEGLSEEDRKKRADFLIVTD